MDGKTEAAGHRPQEARLNLDQTFEIAGGSVAGRDHRASMLNSHDAYYWEAHPGVIVAVVCDGCGSGGHSEVGAKLGARMVVRQVLRWFGSDPKAFTRDRIADRGLPLVRRSVLSQIQLLADQMAGSFSEVVSDYFLFTVVGAIITPEDCFVFGAGDGVVVVNDALMLLGDDKNKPPYLAYSLIETETSIEPKFEVFIQDRQSNVRTILLGTDGVLDFIKAVSKTIPGKDEQIGSIDQFWKNDLFFKNSFGIQRRLALVNRTVTKADYEKKVVHEEHGHLSDDTTILVIRRRKG